MQSTERWLPVVGYEGLYEVSDLGNVRSLDHYARAGKHASRLYRGRSLRIVKQPGSPTRCGVSMHDGAGGQKTRLVHHLVLEAFVGPRARAYAHKRGIEFDPAVADDRYRRIMG